VPTIERNLRPGKYGPRPQAATEFDFREAPAAVGAERDDAKVNLSECNSAVGRPDPFSASRPQTPQAQTSG
jgi:hypothetical protein